MANNDDDDNEEFRNRYLLLISNATEDGKPEAFTNTLVDEIDVVKGGPKEVALININLPTTWHSTTNTTVTGHAFLLQVPTNTASTSNWKNFVQGLCASNKYMIPYGDNAILGTFRSATAYDTVREYLQKGILDPINIYLAGVGLPAETAKLSTIAGDPRVYLYGAVNDGKDLEPNSYVINVLLNEKTAAAVSLYPNEFTKSHIFWKNGNHVKAITVSTPRGVTLWYKINNYNMKLWVDIPVKMKNGLPENTFQMFYIYMSILETRFVGNKQYRLLCAIPNPGKEDPEHAFSYDYTPNPPTYFPIEPRYHERIEITVRDNQDHPVFFEWGTTYALVHIRSKYQRV